MRCGSEMLPLLFIAVLGVAGGGAETKTPQGCPRECTCQYAPLRAASFVITWMTSWGEDDLPEIHPNEVEEAGDLVNSQTAASAGVDVDVVGLHATCALMRDANLTDLLHALPPSTMVLTILQAAGSDLTVLEAGHLKPLNHLRALHLQGYAKQRSTQVSGFFSNHVLQMVEQKELAETVNEEEQDLLLALSEDALAPLTSLQLLDLQYVRIVAAVEGGRLRRDIKPLSSSTLLDMRLPYFLSLTDQLKDIDLPPEILSRLPVLHPYSQAQPEIDLVMLDEAPDDDNVVPYDVFKTETAVVMAPFKAQTELKYLRVAHAKLDRVGHELLAGLSGLHTLTLEHNHIKVLPAAMFTPTPHLQHLSLAHNNILALEGESLAGLDELLTLDLDSNNLDRIGPGSFPRLPRMATLRLLENPLTHVFPFTFTNVNSTETLLLGSRQVSAEIHPDTFRELGALMVLQIENTTLPSLSRALLEGLSNLRELTIHGHVPFIDYDAFTATPKLESLTLSNCHLAKLSLDAFFGLRNLRYLDLSRNALMELSPGTFDHLAGLRELYLHHNNLTTLPPGIFLPLPAKLIQVHQNPWDCTCDLLQLRPAFTNKVRQAGYTTCHWQEKAGMVCKQPNLPRLRYDSRVAPLCATPTRHLHNTVFKVTTRRLKCQKLRKRRLRPRTTDPPPPVTIELKHNLRGKAEKPVVEENNWIPLAEFSIPLHEVKDLLDIAEAEMPEDAYAPFPDNEEENEATEESNESREQNTENNDLTQELSTASRFGRSQEGYFLEKQKIKKLIETEQRRRGEDLQVIKQRHRIRLAEDKRRLKAHMAEEERREQQRKEQELEELLEKQQLFRMMDVTRDIINGDP